MTGQISQGVNRIKVLAVAAHPDDTEILCAGTLAKMVKSGHKVVICHASAGDKGHYEISPDVLSEIRKREACQAGEVLGCDVKSLELKDGEIYPYDEKTRRMFIDLIQGVEPDIVLTHAINDYMPDHAAVSQLVLDATFLATLPSFSAHGSFAKKVPSLFYMDTLASVSFQPTLYVDITDTFQVKIKALEQHQSQLAWLKAHDNIDIVDFTETQAKMRGFQAGCNYAEAFIQHFAWARPNTIRFPV